MAEFLRSTDIKKTRKPHRCFACNELIDKGSAAVEWVSICDGSVNSAHLHRECWEIVQGICFKCKDCCDFEGFREGFITESIEQGAECYAVAAFNALKLKGAEVV